jgi:alpha-tubulin suppressor-like RCC1 family protein
MTNLNKVGQLGDGNTPTARSTIYNFTQLNNIIDVSVHEFHSLVLHANSSVYGFGQNFVNLLTFHHF